MMYTDPLLPRTVLQGPFRAVAITLSLLVAPLRLWSIAIAQPDLIIYRNFPLPLQAAAFVAFAVLGIAACRGTAGAVRRIAALCFALGCANTVVMFAASVAAGAWLWWACACLVLGWIYWKASGV